MRFLFAVRSDNENAMNALLLRASAVFLLLSSAGLAPSLRASAEGDELRAADAKLNTVYQHALAAMPNASTKAKLREAQRAWVAFRDADLLLNSEIPGAG